MAVTSLTELVMILLLEQLEYISSLSLMALPIMLRKQLMIKYLPIADILLMESTQVTNGIDMNTLWRELLLHRLSDVIKSSRDLQRKVRSYNGSWRDLYLDILWDRVLQQLMDQSTTSNFLQKTRQIFVRVVRIDCHHTKLLDSLFGVDTKAIPGTRSSGSQRRMYGIYCPSCRNSTFIPRRYIMHYADRSNRLSLVYYLSMFWVYGYYRPKQITINMTHIKKCGSGGTHSLSTSILSQYPNVLSTVLTSVRDISLVPVYMNNTQLHTLTALSTGLARSIDSLTLDLASIDPQLQLISAQHLPHSSVTKLTVLNKLDLERQHNKNVFLEQAIAHYGAKLQELILNGVPLTVNTSEVLVLSICGLYSRKRFQGLHLFDAELSVEVMILLMRHFLSSKYNQQLELNSLRVYQYTDTIPMVTGSGSASNTRQKSLALVKMYNDVFADEPLFDALNTMPLERLTITADMVSILKNYQDILVTELVLKVNDFRENSNLHLKGVVTKSGIKRITMEVVLDDWVTSIHSQSNQQVSKTIMDDVVVAMEIAANCGKLSRLQFRSKDHESRILGSSNPLSVPEGTMSLIFNRIFEFRNLHVLSFDLSNFDASSLIQIIVGAWSSRANGVRVKEVVISKFENQLLLVKEQLEEICNNLVLES